MAAHLTGRDWGVSLRRVARGAKLSVARGTGLNAEALYIPDLRATEEVERTQRWLTRTAVAAAMEACGGSS
jgi:hypothetical protein